MNIEKNLPSLPQKLCLDKKEPHWEAYFTFILFFLKKNAQKCQQLFAK